MVTFFFVFFVHYYCVAVGIEQDFKAALSLISCILWLVVHLYARLMHRKGDLVGENVCAECNAADLNAARTRTFHHCNGVLGNEPQNMAVKSMHCVFENAPDVYQP
jgi:hypothetical protein